MPLKERYKERESNADTSNKVFDLTLDSEEEPVNEPNSSDTGVGKGRDESQPARVSNKDSSVTAVATKTNVKKSLPPEKANWKAKLSRNKKSSSQKSNTTSAFQKIFEDDFLDRTDDFSGGCTPYKEVAKRNSSRNTKATHHGHLKKSAVRSQGTENADKRKVDPDCDQPSVSASQDNDPKGDAQLKAVIEASSSDSTDGDKLTKLSELCGQCGIPVDPGDGLKHLQKCLRLKYQRVPLTSAGSVSEPSARRSQDKGDTAIEEEIRSLTKDHGSRTKDCVICQVCGQDISELEVEGRLQHVNGCLDSEVSKQKSNSGQNPTGMGAESPSSRCQICGQDLKQLNSYRRLQHMNHCIDKNEKAEKKNRKEEALIKEARNKVLDCPICGQPLKTQAARKTHLKRCAVSLGVPSSVLIERVKEQEEDYNIKLAAGVIPDVGSFRNDKKKPGRSRGRKKTSGTAGLQNKGRVDSDTQLALALSTSLLEEERRKNKLLNEEVGDLATSTNEGSNINAFSILMTPKPSKINKKSRKKKRDERIPVLLLKTRDDVCQHIADRLAAMFVNQPSRDAPPTPPFPRSRVTGRKNKTYTHYVQHKSHWSLASQKVAWDPDKADLHDAELTPNSEDAGFYVMQLMPPISPCKVKAGSKLRQMSSIPGYTEGHRGNGDSNKQVGEQERIVEVSVDKTLVASTQTAVYLAELAEDSGSTTLDLTTLDTMMTGAVASQGVWASQGEGGSAEEDVEDRVAQGFLTPKQPMLTPVSGTVTQVIKDLAAMVDNPLLSDLAIHTKDDIVRAHKFMLAARCPHLLQDVCGESFLELPNLDATAVRMVLTYIYSGSLGTHSTKLHQVAALASRWRLDGLEGDCLKILEEKVEEEEQEEKEIGQEDHARAAPRLGSSSADATLSNLLHELWGSDYDDSDTDSDDGATDPRDPDDLNDDLEPVYEYMATQKQKQHQRLEEEGSMSSEGEEEREDGSRDEEEKMMGAEPLNESRSKDGSILDLNMTDVHILTQLAALDKSQEGSEMEPVCEDEAGSTGEGTAEESDTELNLAIPMPHSDDELQMEGGNDLETNLSERNKCGSSPLAARKHHLADSKKGKYTHNVHKVQLRKTEEPMDDAKLSTDSDTVNVNLNMTTPSIVRSNNRSHTLVSEVTPDLFMASQPMSPEVHERFGRQSLESDIKKSPNRQLCAKVSPRVSQRSKSSLAESSGSELFDLSVLEDSGCLNKTAYSGANEGLLNADVLSEAESDGCNNKDSSVSNTPSPVFNSRQSRPLKSSQVVANLSRVFEADDSFNLTSGSQTLAMAALADINEEPNKSGSFEKDLIQIEQETALTTGKRKRCDGSGSDLEVPMDTGSRAQKCAKYDVENIRGSPQNESTSSDKSKSAQGPKRKVQSSDSSCQEKISEVMSRSQEGEISETDGYHDDTHPTVGVGAQKQDCFSISSDSDHDLIDLTQEIDVQQEAEKSPESERHDKDICDVKEDVWSDFDDAGFMDDFDSAALTAQSRCSSQNQSMSARPEEEQMSLDMKDKLETEQVSPGKDMRAKADGEQMLAVDEDYDPPTDIETDISIVAEEPAVWHPNKTPKALPQKKKKNMKNAKPPSPFTPMAKYEAMATPELKQNCQKFGIRPLPKKKMLMTLKNIYQETHRYETDSELEESFTASSSIQHTKNDCQLKGLPLENPGETANNSSSDDDHSRFLQPPDVSDLLEEDAQGSPPLSQTSTNGKRGGRDKAAQLKSKREKIRKYILEHKDLYSTILQYEPLEFDDFHRDLKEAGILAGSDVVIDFLDEQNIQFTMRKRKGGDEEKDGGRRGRGQRSGRGRTAQHRQGRASQT